MNISDLVEVEEARLDSFKGRKVALDALNMLYQFLSTIRQPTGEPLKDSEGRVTSHLSGLFYRTAKLVEHEIQPCYVFDGEPPEFKSSVNEKRRKRRKEAKEKYEEALKKGDMEDAQKYAQQSSKIQDEMIDQSKELLDAMGIPWVQAPSEGEAQAARMAKNGDVWAAGSQDFDSLLFGAPVLLRNLTITGKRKLPNKEKYVKIRPEKIDLSATLRKLDIDHDQLILLGILVGTDYNPGGVTDIGPKTALKLVKEHGDIRSLEENVDWEYKNSMEKIFDFFKNPPLEKDYELEWRQPDEEKIKEFLCDRHDFSENRIQKSIDRLKKASEGGTQSRLDSF